MSNNKFHFELKKKTSKHTGEVFFLSRTKKKLQLLLIFKVYHFYLFEK